MADPILGQDAVIQFYKGGDYFNFACATEVEIQFSMETKPVKTVGDGVWKRVRGQALSYQISLSGVLKFDDSLPVAFDLLDYYTNMTDIAFRMIFTDELGAIKVIDGNALPTNVNMGGGADGHATGSITLQGNGQPDIRDVIEACNAEIATAHISRDILDYRFHVDSMIPGSATISRWDYNITGPFAKSGSAFTDGNIPTSFLISRTHIIVGTITVTPICDNGLSGTTYIAEITDITV